MELQQSGLEEQMLDEIFSIIMSQSDLCKVTLVKKGAPGDHIICQLKI